MYLIYTHPHTYIHINTKRMKKYNCSNKNNRLFNFTLLTSINHVINTT